jgi:hypothetical protein
MSIFAHSVPVYAATKCDKGTYLQQESHEILSLIMPKIEKLNLIRHRYKALYI